MLMSGTDVVLTLTTRLIPPQPDSKAQGEWGLRRSYSMQLPATELPAHAFPLLTDWCLSAGFLMMSAL